MPAVVRGRREGMSRNLAQVIGDRGRRSEHAPDLVDAESVEAELTHDRHGSASARPILGRMNPRVRRLIVSGVLGGLVLIVLLTAVWDLVR